MFALRAGHTKAEILLQRLAVGSQTSRFNLRQGTVEKHVGEGYILNI